MENTHEFVENLHEKQRKDQKNREHQGNGTPNEKLPTKQHGTNK